ncbi:MAG: hypothetical protein LUE86_02590, partial [Clostridiales bacterium]|nr:hypothetical protein [Clostridiales bacterium]
MKDKMWIVCTCICTLCLLCMLSNRPAETRRMPEKENRSITYEVELPEIVKMVGAGRERLE